VSCDGDRRRSHLHLVLPDGVVVHTVVTVTGAVVGTATGVVVGGAVGVGAGTVVGAGAGAGAGEVGDGDGEEVTGTVVAALVEPADVLEEPLVEPVAGVDEAGDDEPPTFERVVPLDS